MGANTPSSTMCSVLWNHLFLSPQGYLKPCCRFQYSKGYSEPTEVDRAFTSAVWEKIREEMKSGARSEGCRRCYEEEDAGKKSLRMRYNAHPTLGLKTVDVEKPAITWLEIALSNRCNVACRMCDSRYSTRWLKDEVALGMTNKASHKLFELDLNAVRAIAKELRHVKITGGEPLYDKAHPEFLKIMTEEADPSRVFLNYSTNLTLFPSEEVLELWSRFERVELALSLDSIVPSEMNYMRYPTDGERALEHTEKYIALLKRMPNLHLILRPTINIFNIHSIPDTYAWWLERKTERMSENATHLTFPEHLRATLMSPEQKRAVSLKYASFRERGNPALNGVLDYLEQFYLSADESERYPEFLAKTEALDRVRGHSFREFFPHLS
jgi:hypothetical protein